MVAVVTDPQGLDTDVRLDPQGDGRFAGAFATAVPGLHVVRFLATGGLGRKGRFQREDTRTVSVFRGEIPKGIGWSRRRQGPRAR